MSPRYSIKDLIKIIPLEILKSVSDGNHMLAISGISRRRNQNKRFIGCALFDAKYRYEMCFFKLNPDLANYFFYKRYRAYMSKVVVLKPKYKKIIENLNVFS